jgi:hypothetical protein
LTRICARLVRDLRRTDGLDASAIYAEVYAYHFWDDYSSWKLYSLSDDPYELENLSGQHPELQGRVEGAAHAAPELHGRGVPPSRELGEGA